MLVMTEPWDDGEISPGLLERCRAGEPAALGAFVEFYQRSVFALLSRTVGGRAEVEDLAQETFLRAIRALPAFDADRRAKLSTWLLTIATRLALDTLRRQSRERRNVFTEEPDGVATPEKETQRSELRGAIGRAIDELPADQRAAFVLAEFHGFPLEDIATALKAPKATIKTRLFRARSKLSRALARHLGDGE